MNKEDIIVLLRAHRRVGNYDTMFDYLDEIGEFKDCKESGDRKESVMKWLYPTWVNSEEWKRIRKKKLLSENLQCEICGTAKNLQVHHITYEHLLVEDMFPDDLVVLCKDCHENVHSNDILKKKRAADIDINQEIRNQEHLSNRHVDGLSKLAIIQKRIAFLSSSENPDELVTMIDLKKLINRYSIDDISKIPIDELAEITPQEMEKRING